MWSEGLGWSKWKMWFDVIWYVGLWGDKVFG